MSTNKKKQCVVCLKNRDIYKYFNKDDKGRKDVCKSCESSNKKKLVQKVLPTTLIKTKMTFYKALPNEVSDKVVKFKKSVLEQMLQMLKQSGAQEIGINIKEE